MGGLPARFLGALDYEGGLKAFHHLFWSQEINRDFTLMDECAPYNSHTFYEGPRCRHI